MTLPSVWVSRILSHIEKTGCFTQKIQFVKHRHRFVHNSNVIFKMKGRKTSSQQWLQRQLADPFVKKARYESYRCRSAFKLLEIQEKLGILTPGMTVIDCGAAPGSWTQVAVQKVNSLRQDRTEAQGCVISVDLQHMIPVPGAQVLSEADFTAASSQKEILTILNGQLADVILSDMAPNATGVKSLDHDNIVELCFSVLDFAGVVLKAGGAVVCKIWQGGEQGRLMDRMKAMFTTVKVVKPHASRKDSAEVFLLGRDFKRESPGNT